MSLVELLVVYCVLILAGSLAGGWLPMLVRLTHTRLQLGMSFVGGAMLGVGLLHLLPHAYFALGDIYPVVIWMLAGFVLMFFIERVFHFHHHDVPDGDEPCSHHNHDHAHDHQHSHETGSTRPASWGGAFVGLALHSTLDGVALAAGTSAEFREGQEILWPGLAVFLAVFLHKPFDSLTLGALLTVGGRSKRLRHVVNTLYALTIPLGVVLFQLGIVGVGGADERVVGYVLALAAGMFLCIATSDLLPELQFHAHDRLRLSIALLLGLALSWGIVAIEESGHQHGPGGGHEHHDHGHDHGHKH